MAGLLSAYGYKVTLGGSSSSDEKAEGCGCTDGGDCKSKEKHTDEECECQGDCKGKEVSPKTDEQEKEAADLWLLNSCTVKGPAEDHFRNAVIAAKSKGKKVVVAGCVPQGSPNVAYLKVSLAIFVIPYQHLFFL